MTIHTTTTTMRIICLLVLITTIKAAPKPFTCMSYMEDEDFQQDDDDREEYSPSAENEITPEPEQESTVRRRRVCQPDYTFCFSLWRQSGNGTQFVKQGCWKESTEGNATCSQTECTSSAPTSQNTPLYYCCCSGDSCNQNVAVVEPAPLELSNQVPSNGLTKDQQEAQSIWGAILIYSGLLSVITIIGVLASYFYCRSTREKPVPEEAPLAPSGPGYSSNLRNVDNINLICMLGNGKYGTVMKGVLHDEEVAVKIFPEAHYQYYINERNIYSLPLMDCPALLNYFGYDERQTMDGRVEYQLVLSLAPMGCLQDYLIANASSFEIFCGMAKSITRGLSHLHTELRRGSEHKPCVAHRDLNSRNVLVKADLTCCIADFGFALKVFGSKYEYKGETAMAETKSINEVGTLRYMAPELLEGAVNLRDCETSLKQMDVYALGLVLWEVATRCVDFYASAQVVPSYTAPYELEVGTHPSFDQMQALVVRRKARPLFPSSWGGGAAAKLIRDTCEDCWDHDAEARLTSLCVEERMHEVAGLRPRLHPLTQSSNPLLNANNLTNEHVDSSQSKHSSHSNVESSETSAILNPPPNQQILPATGGGDSNRVENFNPGSTPYIHTEKNHLIYTQQQLQPYQGRNPCQERNLAPIIMRPQQVLVEKSKKHSFQTAQENSFSCLEDDVSVEDLISNGNSKKLAILAQDVANMGQGFPKQQNTDKKLRGWHGVRALIQKKLFRKEYNSDVFRQLAYGDEKSNLVDNRYAAVVKGLDACTPTKVVTVSLLDDTQFISSTSDSVKITPQHDVTLHQNKRPNNLELSAINTPGMQLNEQTSRSSLLMQSIAEEDNTNLELQHAQTVAVPRSRSTSLLKTLNNNNNNLSKTELKLLCTAERTATTDSSPSDVQLRRQRSLEVFREVFNGSGTGSMERLRNPSQRVKTPGDVPPSVRKVRASKTLSLYDDRMMDSSTLNIL